MNSEGTPIGPGWFMFIQYHDHGGGNSSKSKQDRGDDQSESAFQIIQCLIAFLEEEH